MKSNSRYQNLELQPIAGQWRAGSAERNLDVIDPFTGESLLRLPMASREDLDQAYRVAQTAQVEWAAMGPTARGDVMRRAVNIFNERKEEILDWLIRESGAILERNISQSPQEYPMTKHNVGYLIGSLAQESILSRVNRRRAGAVTRLAFSTVG